MSGTINEVALANGDSVSMQVVQQIYKDVTGKTERLAKAYSINHQTVFGDIESLNRRLAHVLEQYNVVQGGCNVTFSHVDNSSERYSSFERACVYDAGSTIPIENVNIEYNFLIVLPVAQKPETYKVVVNLRSRAALLEKAREQDNFEAQFISLFASKTGMVSVDYVDYAVARNIFREIDQWFESLHSIKSNFAITLLKSWSHNFKWFFSYATAFFLMWIFVAKTSALGSSSPHIDLRFGLVSFGAIFIGSGLAGQAGRWLESLVDAYQPLSYLNFNRGDERLVTKYQNSVRKKILMAIISFALAIAINLLSAWLSLKVGIQ